MATSNTSTKAAPGPTEKALAAKWGKAAIEARWTGLPNVLFRNPKALKLKRLDVLVILHLASYWWSPDRNPWPSKASIADALDVHPRSVQASIAKMEAMGYVQRIERKAEVGDNLPNEYDLSGLVKAIEPLAVEELEKKERRAAEDRARITTPAAFALVQGGKKDQAT